MMVVSEQMHFRKRLFSTGEESAMPNARLRGAGDVASDPPAGLTSQRHMRSRRRWELARRSLDLP